MSNEELLNLVKAVKNEQTLLAKLKGLYLAIIVSSLYAAILAFACVISHYMTSDAGNYDYRTVMCMIVSICTVNFAVSAGYEFLCLKKRSKLIDFLLFGVVSLLLIANVVLFFI